MKIVEKVLRVKDGCIKPGEIYSVQDTLSCDEGVYLITKVAGNSINMIRLGNLNEIEVNAARLENMEFYKCTAVREDRVQNKQQCEEKTDLYRKDILDKIKDYYL